MSRGLLPFYSFDRVEVLETLQNFALTGERFCWKLSFRKVEKGDCRVSALQLTGVRACLRGFLLQGPVSTFVGTTAIRASFEDAPHVENLGPATRSVLIKPSIQCRASDCPRGATILVEGQFQLNNLWSVLGQQERRRRFAASVQPVHTNSDVTRTSCPCLVRNDHFFARPVFIPALRNGSLPKTSDASVSRSLCWPPVRRTG